jgi:DnaJ-class molecular chaperone
LGCSKQLKGHPGFPDGLQIDIPQGYTNDDVMRIADKGMPKKGLTAAFGNLICKIRVQITEAEKDVLVKNKTLLSVMFSNQVQTT